jgi:chlorobactene glucosyltransferase
MYHLTEVLLALVIACWMALYVYWHWALSGVTVLGPGSERRLPEEPKVSVLVAARNEEKNLTRFLSSVLSLDYPNYEVILVDDASTDGTGALADEWARGPIAGGRLTVIHNEHLPPGWSGKVHALSLAEVRSQGDWILTCDADIELHPSTLAVALALAIRSGTQLVSIAPTVHMPSFWARVIAPAFALFIMTLYPLRSVNGPTSKDAIASGAFMLMRREDFRSLGGFEVVRDAVLDDQRIAAAFKRGGRRIHMAVGNGLVRTSFHERMGEIWEGLARCVFEGAGYSTIKIAGGIAASFVIVVWPWLVLAWALAIRQVTGVGVMALIASGLGSLAYGLSLRGMGGSLLYAPAFPLATLIYEGIATYAIYKNLFSSGVSWKQRQYRAAHSASRATTMSRQ